ncbi:MAG TPA: dihydroorotate dehydrogenase electron transfer subunit [Patescibacteria group bacterium]|nr:dihydroorotate dehydrogenase electron transfer subunit [Patescibacteria group bacterium]
MSSNPQPVDLDLRVESHEPLGASHFLLTLATGGALTRWDPGQFAMIALGREPASIDPLLRRPFSIFNLPGSPAGMLQIFYKILGRGTSILSRARPGDRIRCLAPLGHGFAPGRDGDSRLLLVAGGIGSASLHPLALQERSLGRDPLMLYGCRTADEIAGILPTRQAGIDVRVSTDDGSTGRKGYVSGLLDDFLTAEGAHAARRWVVCACGPMPMMQATSVVAARHRVACFVSLESPMACGFGVCVGCVVPTKGQDHGELSYRRICVDGPVFDATVVAW